MMRKEVSFIALIFTLLIFGILNASSYNDDFALMEEGQYLETPAHTFTKEYRLELEKEFQSLNTSSKEFSEFQWLGFSDADGNKVYDRTEAKGDLLEINGMYIAYMWNHHQPHKLLAIN